MYYDGKTGEEGAPTFKSSMGMKHVSFGSALPGFKSF